MYPEESAELATLEAAAGDYADEDEARTALLDNALDVQVRSGWTATGQQLVPGEFMLLLCTGGPAVRIVGELEDGTVTRAWMEYSDWSTSWTECFAEGIDNDVLAEYAGFFFA